MRYIMFTLGFWLGYFKRGFTRGADESKELAWKKP